MTKTIKAERMKFHNKNVGAPAAPALARRVRRATLSPFYIIDRMPSFYIRYSPIKVSFIDQTGRSFLLFSVI